MSRVLWKHSDATRDTGALEAAAAEERSNGTVGVLLVDSDVLHLDRAAAETLREALDRLLDVDEQQAPAAARPSQLQLAAQRLADNLDGLDDNARARAQDFACRDAGWVSLDVQRLAIEVRTLRRRTRGRRCVVTVAVIVMLGVAAVAVVVVVHVAAAAGRLDAILAEARQARHAVDGDARHVDLDQPPAPDQWGQP